MKYKLGIIGFGVMGQAIASRILSEKILNEGEICVFDLDESKVKAFGYDVDSVTSAQEVVNKSERILFAVKPQHYSDICASTDFKSDAPQTVLSIMAGVKIESLRNHTGLFDVGFVRIMPNMPCKLGKGVCGVHFDKVNDEEREFITKLLSACGGVVPIEENQFDAVTGVSGSGPAYVYLFAEGMIRGGMNGGLSYEASKTLALDTIIGAAELAKQSDEPIDVLVERVCSKGGTTIEAVNIYRDRDLVGLIADGIDACRNKSAKLSENNK